MALPAHQRIILSLLCVGSAFLIVGAALDTLSNAVTWITMRITYAGTAILLLALPTAHLALRRWPLEWVVSGTPTRIKGLGVTPVAVTAGLIALLWIPRAVERFSKPTDRATIQWSELLWEGQTLTVNIGDIPENAKGGLLVEGRSYLIRFRREHCVWDSLGPSGGPFYERNYLPVENHYNKAGPKVAPHLTLKQSGAQTSECNSPRDRKLMCWGSSSTSTGAASSPSAATTIISEKSEFRSPINLVLSERARLADAGRGRGQRPSNAPRIQKRRAPPRAAQDEERDIPVRPCHDRDHEQAVRDPPSALQELTGIENE